MALGLAPSKAEVSEASGGSFLVNLDPASRARREA